jgi:uncharacterized membrane protein YqjE
MANEDRSIRSLLADLVAGVNTLIRQELRLAQVESSENLSHVLNGLLGILAGLLVALTALLVLVQALVVALANVMPPAYAALLVGSVLAIIACVLIQIGQSRVKVGSLVPERTLESLGQARASVPGQAR